MKFNELIFTTNNSPTSHKNNVIATDIFRRFLMYVFEGVLGKFMYYAISGRSPTSHLFVDSLCMYYAMRSLDGQL